MKLYAVVGLLLLGLVLTVYTASAQEGVGPEIITSAIFDPSGTRLAVASGPYFCSTDVRRHAIDIIDVSSGDVIASLQRHICLVTDFAWSPDGSQIASAGDDGLSLVWDVATERVVTTFEGSQRGLRRAAPTWNASGDLIADFVVLGTQVTLWSPATGEIVASIPAPEGARIGTIAWSESGILALASQDANLYLYQISGTASAPEVQLTAAFSNVTGYDLQWDATSSRLAIGGHDAVYLLDSTDESMPEVLGETNARVISLSWDPTSQHLLSARYDDNIAQVWNVATGTVEATLLFDGSLYIASWSPDGEHLVLAGQGANPLIIMPVSDVLPAATPTAP